MIGPLMDCVGGPNTCDYDVVQLELWRRLCSSSKRAVSMFKHAFKIVALYVVITPGSMSLGRRHYRRSCYASD
jgi:hypothetical protein